MDHGDNEPGNAGTSLDGLVTRLGRNQRFYGRCEVPGHLRSRPAFRIRHGQGVKIGHAASKEKAARRRLMGVFYVGCGASSFGSII